MCSFAARGRLAGARGKTSNRERRHYVGDALRRIGSVGPIPVRGPVECAEKGAGGEGGVCGLQLVRPHPLGDQGADAALVAIALGDDRGAQPFGQGIEFEMRSRALQFVNHAEDVGSGERAQPVGERADAAPRIVQRRQQAIERPVLAEVEQFVLAFEVVIQVAGRQVGGDGDVAHPGRGKAAVAKNPGGGAQDFDPARVGSS